MIYQQCANYLREHDIKRVVLKASALTMGSIKKAHLETPKFVGL